MVKAYLRYELSDTWGVIASRSDICHDASGKFVFTASLERVAVWDVKQAVLVRGYCRSLLFWYLYNVSILYACS